MRRHILPTAIEIFGAVIAVSSIWRWNFYYYEVYKVVVGVLIGLGFMASGHLYNWMRNIENDLENLHSQADALGAKKFGLEKEAIEEKARGVRE